MTSTARRRWPWVTAAGGTVAVLAFGMIWFQPHKLWVDDKVDQGVPTARTGASSDEDTASTTPTPPSTPSTSAMPAAPAGPVDLATGSFVSLDHGTSGTARIIQIEDGRRFVRFEGFETSNGPDLFVYLTTNPAAGPEGAFDDDYLDLGRLQGNIGDQNYELPADVDPSTYPTVVVWCDRFDSAFGAADLVPPA